MSKEELDAFRHDMIRRLHHPTSWGTVAVDASGGTSSRVLLACPFCGCLVHVGLKEVHIAWHERNNA